MKTRDFAAKIPRKNATSRSGGEMLHSSVFSPLNYSPGEAASDCGWERRPSGSDPGYFSSSASLANASASCDGNETFGVELERNNSSNISNSNRAGRYQGQIEGSMSFCDPDEIMFSLVQNQQQHAELNQQQQQQQSRYGSPSDTEAARRSSVTACHAGGVRGQQQQQQFSHSENSAFMPSFYSGQPKNPSAGNQRRISGRPSEPCARLGNDVSLQMPSSVAGDTYDQSPGLFMCNSAQVSCRQDAAATRRQLSAEDYKMPHHYLDADDPKSAIDSSAGRGMRIPGGWEPQLVDDFSLVDTPLLDLSRHPNPTSGVVCDMSPDKPVDLTQSFAVNQGNYEQHMPSRSAESAVMASMGLASAIGSVSMVRDSGKMRYTSEDEAWKSYLENPLTGRTTAMISIQGDKESANALGILYDHYKVPQEKRVLTCESNCSPQHGATTNTRNRQDFDTSNGTMSDEVSVLSPVSSECSRTNSNLSGQTDILLRDVISESVPSSPGHHVSMSDVTTLNTVRSEFGGLVTETVAFPSDYIQHKYHHDPHPGQGQTPSVPGVPDHRHQRAPGKALDDRISPTCFQAFENSNNNNNSNSGGCGVPLQRSSSVSSSSNLLGSPSIGLGSAFVAQHNQHGDPLQAEYGSSNCFEYVMEAPKSLKQKEGEPTMSYINKGQFYCITLRDCSGALRSRLKSGSRVTSVVQVVFGDGKPEEEQLRHWKYWHSRQHTAKQRVIDIADYKESCMISDIAELAHNAISFNWDTNEPAKIFISCNCLSTDFSAQKGIKGLPLLLQIDTYLDDRRVGYPVHRGVCQLKVFCDKGAERKIRDEERKALRKKQKAKGMAVQQRMAISPVDIKPVIESPNVTPPPQPTSSSLPGVTSHRRYDVVHFKTMSDHVTPSVYFVPDVYVPNNRVQVTMSPCQRTPENLINGIMTPTSVHDLDQVFIGSALDYSESPRGAHKRSQSMVSSEDGDFPPPGAKVPRKEGPGSGSGDQRVILYVKKGDDDEFDCVMLREPTLRGLKEAIEEKYAISAEKISKVLKKSKKGILVRVDDNIVRHYSDEETFAIEITNEESANGDVTHQVTLTTI